MNCYVQFTVGAMNSSGITSFILLQASVRILPIRAGSVSKVTMNRATCCRH
jgi:hypothetical protein